MVAVFLEAGAIQGGGFDMVGDLVGGVHAHEHAGFAGNLFQFFVGLMGAGPALLFFLLNSLMPTI